MRPANPAEALNPLVALIGVALVFLCFPDLGTTRGAEIEFTLQTRNSDSGEIVLTPERINPKRTGVIAVDVWNSHEPGFREDSFLSYVRHEIVHTVHGLDSRRLFGGFSYP